MPAVLERNGTAHGLVRSAPRQATTDSQIVDLWLHGRPPHTQRAYRADVKRFLTFVATPLSQVGLGDVQDFVDSLAHLKPASRARVVGSVKSLLAFGHQLGYLPFDVGRAVKLPPRKDTLSERILNEADVVRMLALEPNHRNRVLLRLLYAAGLRVSELVALKWLDLVDRDDAGQITVFGKGGKTRTVLLPSTIWADLRGLRRGASSDAPVFVSRSRGGHLDPRQVERIVLAAAQRADIPLAVSPHWLRHAHASHALDRLAPIHLVQATLGHASVATTGRYLHARPNDSSAKYLAI